MKSEENHNINNGEKNAFILLNIQCALWFNLWVAVGHIKLENINSNRLFCLYRVRYQQRRARGRWSAGEGKRYVSYYIKVLSSLVHGRSDDHGGCRSQHARINHRLFFPPFQFPSYLRLPLLCPRTVPQDLHHLVRSSVSYTSTNA